MAQATIGFEQAAQVSTDGFGRRLADQAWDVCLAAVGFIESIQHQELFYAPVVDDERHRTVIHFLKPVDFDSKQTLQQPRHFSQQVGIVGDAHPDAVVIGLRSNKAIAR